MLLQFSINNFKTFKEHVQLNMYASQYDKKTLVRENIYNDDKFKLRINKSAVIYGANASGKSKLIEAFNFMKYFVVNSALISQSGSKIHVQPFLLNEVSEKAPSEFEVIFLFNNIRYRYGFEVNQDRVISEWFFYKQNTKEVELFYRDLDSFNIHARDFTKGKSVVNQKLVRDNVLLISVAAQFNEIHAINLLTCFNKMNVISGTNEASFRRFTYSKLNDTFLMPKMIEFLRAADFGIDDIEVKRLNKEEIPDSFPDKIKDILMTNESFAKILTKRRKYDNNRFPIGEVLFSLAEDESSGTQQFFSLTGPILEAIENGSILIVDELDSKLHPNLVAKIVSLFHNPLVNIKNAQLIFNTHDTNLLRLKIFRRDQVWFVQKNKYGEATLYSLSDFKSENVRKSEPFEENYLRGKYGAVPYLDFFESIENMFLSNENEK